MRMEFLALDRTGIGLWRIDFSVLFHFLGERGVRFVRPSFVLFWIDVLLSVHRWEY